MNDMAAQADAVRSLLVVDHPLVQHKLSLLRDVGTSTVKFRQLLTEIGLLLGYEATRGLAMELRTISTPICDMRAPVLAGEKMGIRNRFHPAVTFWGTSFSFAETFHMSDRHTTFHLADDLELPLTKWLEVDAGLLLEVDKQTVASRLPERVRDAFASFRRCPSCDRVYWAGSHYRRMLWVVESILGPSGHRTT